ncbi:MAG: hypothetical protein IT305_08805 [Chloroflexi bacterium]|nr:hypothetical protein [Chloroflexota bacterium]
MRTFVVGWLVAFCLVGLSAAGIGWLVTTAPSLATRQPSVGQGTDKYGRPVHPFSQREAVEVVGRRFGQTTAAERLRGRLRASGVVSYHSSQHWRVCLEQACWIAHGPGRYAEPENDAAREREEQLVRGT